MKTDLLQEKDAIKKIKKLLHIREIEGRKYYKTLSGQIAYVFEVLSPDLVEDNKSAIGVWWWDGRWELTAWYANGQSSKIFNGSSSIIIDQIIPENEISPKIPRIKLKEDFEIGKTTDIRGNENVVYNETPVNNVNFCRTRSVMGGLWRLESESV